MTCKPYIVYRWSSRSVGKTYDLYKSNSEKPGVIIKKQPKKD